MTSRLRASFTLLLDPIRIKWASRPEYLCTSSLWELGTIRAREATRCYPAPRSLNYNPRLDLKPPSWWWVWVGRTTRDYAKQGQIGDPMPLSLSAVGEDLQHRWRGEDTWLSSGMRGEFLLSNIEWKWKGISMIWWWAGQEEVKSRRRKKIRIKQWNRFLNDLNYLTRWIFKSKIFIKNLIKSCNDL